MGREMSINFYEVPKNASAYTNKNLMFNNKYLKPGVNTSFRGIKTLDRDVYEKDDGVISFKDKLKNFGRGLISPITALFSSKKNFITGAAMIAGGAVLTIASGGALAPVFIASGIGFGAYKIGTGAYKAYNAKTDAEAAAAWQSMGAGTISAGLSIAGAKSALKTAGIKTEGLNPLTAAIECFKQTPSMLCKSFKTLTSSRALVNLGLKKPAADTKPESKPQQAPEETQPSGEELAERAKELRQEIDAAKQDLHEGLQELEGTSKGIHSIRRKQGINDAAADYLNAKKAERLTLKNPEASELQRLAAQKAKLEAEIRLREAHRTMHSKEAGVLKIEGAKGELAELMPKYEQAVKIDKLLSNPEACRKIDGILDVSDVSLIKASGGNRPIVETVNAKQYLNDTIASVKSSGADSPLEALRRMRDVNGNTPDGNIALSYMARALADNFTKSLGIDSELLLREYVLRQFRAL